MSIPQSDAINSRAAEVAEWLPSAIDIPDSQLGTTPHEEPTHKIDFCIPHILADSISEKDYDKYYEPCVVSIGPFYSSFEPMGNNSKRKAVKKLAESVNASIEQVYASVEQDLLRITKECYHVDTWDVYSEREWCLMMFLDGCFIIEFISNHISGFGRRSSLNMKKPDRDLVLRDLLLFKNQLPFQVLAVLARAFQCQEFDLLRMVLFQIPLFKIYSYTKGRRPLDYGTQAPLHLLQYYRDLWNSVLVGYDVEEDNNIEDDDIFVYLPFSVTELKKVGIRCSSCATDPSAAFHFKSSMLSGKLFLPQLIIEEWTMTLLYNLVTYEFSHSLQNRSFGISYYLRFMNMLINGEEDVKELRDRGVIQLNHKVDDDQVVHFLRDITAHLEPNPQEFKDVKRQISTYNRSKRLPLRIGYAEFKQRYFSGPWSFLVFLAVIFTVSMTVIQTVFTGIQTYKKN